MSEASRGLYEFTTGTDPFRHKVAKVNDLLGIRQVVSNAAQVYTSWYGTPGREIFVGSDIDDAVFSIYGRKRTA